MSPQDFNLWLSEHYPGMPAGDALVLLDAYTAGYDNCKGVVAVRLRDRAYDCDISAKQNRLCKRIAWGAKVAATVLREEANKLEGES